MTGAVLGVNLGLGIYSGLILMFLFFSSLRERDELVADSRSRRLFLAFLVITFIEIISDLVSRFDGYSGAFVPLCHIGNFLLFLLNPAMVFAWALYTWEQIDLDKSARRKALVVQSCLFSANAAAVIINPFTGILYYFDSNNVYHRGMLFVITSVVMVMMMAYMEFVLIKKRRDMEKVHFWAFLLFPVLPAVASALQVIFYGYSFALNTTVFSALIVFIYVKNRSMDIDYLTGLYNRRKLDNYLHQKIASCAAGRSFSAILLDINHFKSINDALGHQAGDTALTDAAAILRGVLRADTFIARYGGDEFCIILDDDDRANLQNIMQRISQATDVYNHKGCKSFTIAFSMGGDVYDYASHMTTAQFQDHIDALMYEQKRSVSSYPNGTAATVVAPSRRSTDRL